MSQRSCGVVSLGGSARGICRYALRAEQPPGSIDAIDEKSALGFGKPERRSAEMTSDCAADGSPATPDMTTANSRVFPETFTMLSQLHSMDGMIELIAARAWAGPTDAAAGDCFPPGNLTDSD